MGGTDKINKNVAISDVSNDKIKLKSIISYHLEDVNKYDLEKSS